MNRVSKKEFYERSLRFYGNECGQMNYECDCFGEGCDDCPIQLAIDLVEEKLYELKTE